VLANVMFVSQESRRILVLLGFVSFSVCLRVDEVHLGMYVRSRQVQPAPWALHSDNAVVAQAKANKAAPPPWAVDHKSQSGGASSAKPRPVKKEFVPPEPPTWHPPKKGVLQPAPWALDK
jgi:hypothetical protein